MVYSSNLAKAKSKLDLYNTKWALTSQVGPILQLQIKIDSKVKKKVFLPKKGPIRLLKKCTL